MHLVTDIFVASALGCLHKNRTKKQTEHLCVSPVSILEKIWFSYSQKKYKKIRLVLCVVEYLSRSLTWVTRHFMWPLSLWMKTTPSPVCGPLTKGGQTAVAWKPELFTIMLCCFESPLLPLVAQDFIHCFKTLSYSSVRHTYHTVARRLFRIFDFLTNQLSNFKGGKYTLGLIVD